MRRAKKAVDASEAFSICKKCSKLPETAIFGSFLDESVFFEYGSSERNFFLYVTCLTNTPIWRRARNSYIVHLEFF